MSPIAQELIAKIESMDEHKQLQVLEFVNSLEQPKMSWDEWLKLAKTLHDDLVVEYGESHYFNSVDVLNEVREERLDDLRGGR